MIFGSQLLLLCNSLLLSSKHESGEMICAAVSCSSSGGCLVGYRSREMCSGLTGRGGDCGTLSMRARVCGGIISCNSMEKGTGQGKQMANEHNT